MTNYNERLSAYIRSESARLGNLSDLYRAFVHLAKDDEIPVSRSTLDAWAKQSIDSDIKAASLAQLARYRGESQADTIAWLHGGDRTEDGPITQGQIDRLDLEGVAIVMEMLVARVRAIDRAGKIGG